MAKVVEVSPSGRGTRIRRALLVEPRFSPGRETAERDAGRGARAGEAERRRGREHGHPGCRQDECGDHEREPAPAARAGTIGNGSRPGHQEEQQGVVDGHDETDRRPLIPQRLADEGGHERADERTGDARKETAQPDERDPSVGRPRSHGARVLCSDQQISPSRSIRATA
jgi:hypothetical protein